MNEVIRRFKIGRADGDQDPGLWEAPALVEDIDDGASDDEEDVTLIVGEWRFLGLGYTTPGDALLAAYAHAEHLETLELLRQLEWT